MHDAVEAFRRTGLELYASMKTELARVEGSVRVAVVAREHEQLQLLHKLGAAWAE